jgi:hypothetical protein
MVGIRAVRSCLAETGSTDVEVRIDPDDTIHIEVKDELP